MSKKKRKKPEGLSAKPVAPSGTIKKGLSLSRLHLLAVALIVVVALGAYANTFHVPFQFDDRPNIIENPDIKIKAFTLDRLEQLVRNIFAKNIRVFSYFTFALNYYFSGSQVFGYHVVNLLIHMASGIFLYWFLLLTLNLSSLKDRYGRLAFPIALFSSLLFISHPIQTQSVTYIVQRMASMAGMFYLLAMLLYVKGRLSHRRWSLLYFAGTAVSYLLALSSKENSAVLPLFIGLYEFYFFQNLDFSPAGRKKLIYLTGAVLVIGVSLLLYWGKRGQGLDKGFQLFNLIAGAYRGWDFTLLERVLTQFRVVLYYVTLLLYPLPSRFNLDYAFSISRGIFDPPTTLISILVVAVLTGYSLWTAKKRPLVSYCILWYFGNLALESSIFPLDLAFEHRLYLPAIGPFILIAILVVKGWEKIKGIEHSRQKAVGRRQKAEGKIQEAESRRQEAESSLRRDLPLWMFILLITFLFCLGTYSRNALWKNEITLWEDCAKKSPYKPRVHNILGYYLVMDKQFERGVEELNFAIRLSPRFDEPRFNLGLAYGEMKQFDKALFHLKEYLRLVPEDPEAYSEIGLINLQMKKVDEAILNFKKALEINPTLAKIHANLGNAFLQAGMLDEAISEYKKALLLDLNLTFLHVRLAEAYEKKGLSDLATEEIKEALRIDPSLYEAHSVMGASYIEKGRMDDAIAELNQALESNSKDPSIYNNLGVAYRKKRMMDEAIANYKKALDIDPSFSDARVNLAEVYFEKGMVNEAVTELEHAARLDPNKAEVHNNLGVIFLQRKKFDEAILSFKKAVTINPKYGDAYFNLAVAHYYKKDIRSASLYAKKALDLGYEVDPRLLKILRIR